VTLRLTDVITCQLICFKISMKAAHQNPKTNSQIFLCFLIQYFLILPVLIYGYGTCCLTAREEHRLSRMKSGNAYCHSVQNLLSSRLLSKNIKIKIYRNIILPIVLYECKTWSLTLREECRLRVFENRVLRTCLVLRGMS
jgi:hypothetical protein